MSVRPEVVAYWEKHWPPEEVEAMKRAAAKKAGYERIERQQMLKLGLPVTTERPSTIFLKTPEWKALRSLVLEFYGCVCMKCGATKRIQVDHIKPKSRYPELALAFSNLQVLCWLCNKAKWHDQSEVDYRQAANDSGSIPSQLRA